MALVVSNRLLAFIVGRKLGVLNCLVREHPDVVGLTVERLIKQALVAGDLQEYPSAHLP
jgi:hypothetical protein